MRVSSNTQSSGALRITLYLKFPWFLKIDFACRVAGVKPDGPKYVCHIWSQASQQVLDHVLTVRNVIVLTLLKLQSALFVFLKSAEDLYFNLLLSTDSSTS